MDPITEMDQSQSEISVKRLELVWPSSFYNLVSKLSQDETLHLQASSGSTENGNAQVEVVIFRLEETVHCSLEASGGTCSLLLDQGENTWLCSINSVLSANIVGNDVKKEVDSRTPQLSDRATTGTCNQQQNYMYVDGPSQIKPTDEIHPTCILVKCESDDGTSDKADVSQRNADKVIDAMPPCPECGTAIPQDHSLMAHYRSQHSRLPHLKDTLLDLEEVLYNRALSRKGYAACMFTCPFCQKSRRGMGILTHIRWCHYMESGFDMRLEEIKREYTSRRKSIKVGDRQDLDTSIRALSTKPEDCDTCYSVPKRRQTRRPKRKLSQYDTCHGEETDSEGDCEVLESVSETKCAPLERDSLIPPCPECNIKMFDDKSLMDHYRTVHSYVPQLEGKVADLEEALYQRGLRYKSYAACSTICPVCERSRRGISILTHFRWCHFMEPNFGELLEETTKLYQSARQFTNDDLSDKLLLGELKSTHSQWNTSPQALEQEAKPATEQVRSTYDDSQSTSKHQSEQDGGSSDEQTKSMNNSCDDEDLAEYIEGPGKTRCPACPECGITLSKDRCLILHFHKRHNDVPNVKKKLLKVEELLYQRSLKSKRYAASVMVCPLCQQTRRGRAILTHFRWCHYMEPNFLELQRKITKQYGTKRFKLTGRAHYGFSKDVGRQETENEVNTTAKISENSDTEEPVSNDRENPASNEVGAEETVNVITKVGGELVYCCPWCQVKTKDDRTIVKHFKIRHSIEKDYDRKLKQLDEGLYRVSLRRQTFVPVQMSCLWCPATRLGISIYRHVHVCHSTQPNFSQVKQQLKHQYFIRHQKLKRQHRANSKLDATTTSIKCLSCDFCDQDEDELMAHFKRAHGDNGSFETRILEMDLAVYSEILSRGNLDLQIKKCSYCPVKRRGDFIKKHMLWCHGADRATDEIPSESLNRAGSNRYNCPKCKNISSETTRRVIAHFKKVHRSSSNYKQEILDLDEDLYQQGLLDNKYSRSQVKKTCPICSKERLRSGLLSHVRWCHDMEPNYNDVISVLRNQDTQHIQPSDQEAQGSPRKLQRIDPKTSFLTCRFCQECFETEKAMLLHRTFVCNLNPRRKSRNLVCRFCSVSLPTEEAMEQHMEQHKDQYQCEVCGAQFQYKSSYYQHKRRKHGIGKKIETYKCPICDKEITGRNVYNKHILNHTEEQSGTCEFCGKYFKTLEALNGHRKRIHLNQFTYRCDKCGHGIAKKRLVATHRCGRTRNRGRDKVNLTRDQLLAQDRTMRIPGWHKQRSDRPNLLPNCTVKYPLNMDSFFQELAAKVSGNDNGAPACGEADSPEAGGILQGPSHQDSESTMGIKARVIEPITSSTAAETLDRADPQNLASHQSRMDSGSAVSSNDNQQSVAGPSRATTSQLNEWPAFPPLPHFMPSSDNSVQDYANATSTQVARNSSEMYPYGVPYHKPYNFYNN